MLNCILVGLGGFAGTVLRYWMGLLPIKTDGGFAYKTFAVNIIGSFVIGLITVLAAKNKVVDERVILMLRVGVVGGFTTFSTFAYETADLIQRGSAGTAVCYALLSVVLGVLAVFGAQLLVR